MLDKINPIYAKNDDEILREIGKLIKKRRISANLTQSELSKATGISKEQISLIERSGKTTLATLITLTRKFGLLQQFLSVYEMPKLTPMQKYELEQKALVKTKEKKRVKK